MKAIHSAVRKLLAQVTRRIAVAWITAFALVRHSKMLFSRIPGTPLRGLCIISFATCYEIRFGVRLPVKNSMCIAHFLFFASTRNAIEDQKPYCQSRLEFSNAFLKRNGLGQLVNDYSERLATLEGSRPVVQALANWDNYIDYREQVADLAIKALAIIAIHDTPYEWKMGSSRDCHLLDCLFRLAMLFQLADDIIDYKQDREARLPTLMTCSLESQPADLLKKLIHSYSTCGIPKTADSWMLRVVVILLCLVLRVATSWIPLRYGKSLVDRS